MNFVAAIPSGNPSSQMVAGAYTLYNTSGTPSITFGTTGGQLSANMGANGVGTSTNVLTGAVNLNATAVGNAADTTEDNLMSYALPANSMDQNLRSVRVTAWGDGVSTADATTVKCYFGATAVVTKVLTASQANTWRTTFEVIRTGAATQVASGTLVNGGTASSTVQSNASPGETTSGAITIKCTGQRATTSSANSVRQLGMITEFFN